MYLLKPDTTECNKVYFKVRSTKMYIWIYSNSALKPYLQITVTEHFF